MKKQIDFTRSEPSTIKVDKVRSTHAIGVQATGQFGRMQVVQINERLGESNVHFGLMTAGSVVFDLRETIEELLSLIDRRGYNAYVFKSNEDARLWLNGADIATG